MAEQIAELEQRIVELLESKKSFARVVERMGARSKLIESQLEALQEEQAAVLPEDCSLADWAKAWRERTADFEAQLDCHEEMLASAWTAIGSREEGQFLDEAICQLVAARDCQATRIAELEADRDRLASQLLAVRPILVDADSTLSWIAHRNSAQMIDEDECSRISHAARAAYTKIPKEADRG